MRTLPFVILALAGAGLGRAQDRPLPPAGYGTLKQDDVAVRIATPNFELRLLPLEEEVIRLLAPDAYRSLNALLRARQTDIDSAAARVRVARPRVMFVTIFGMQPQVRFDPQQLFIASRNVFFRPLEIIPLTPGWGEQRISQREQAAALYLFEPAIQIFEPFDVVFEGSVSRQWDRSRRRLEDERARVLARWAAERPDSTER